MKFFNKIIFFLRNKVNIDKKNYIKFPENYKIRNCKIKIRGKNNILNLSENINMNGVNIEIRGENCKISIGKNTIIGKNTYISAREKNIEILIGDNSMLSRNIKIMTSDGHSIYSVSKNLRINSAQDVLIGNNVWIADNVTILKGSKINNGSVVGINSLVTKKFETKNILIAGNPAQKIKENIYWKDELL